MTDKVVFHLARGFESPLLKSYVGLTPTVNGIPVTHIYAMFKAGLKTTEIRRLKKGFRDYWMKRLCRPLTVDEQLMLPLDLAAAERTAVDLSSFLKVKRAWLVEGYPKGLLPRLEADIKGLDLFPQADDCRLEIHLKNFVEVTKP